MKVKQSTAKTGLFLHRKPKRNAHFWTCQKCALHIVGVSVINYGDV